jgi:signal transduction histidine kinase/DNA-binding NarL/FixJ family response regulator
MRLDKHFLGTAGIVLATSCLIALTWIATGQEISAERQENAATVEASLDHQALGFSEQINLQIQTLDETLSVFATARENNPDSFDLAAWNGRVAAPDDLGRDMILTDQNGVIRQSTTAGEVNRTVAGEDYFQTLSKQTDAAHRLFIGPATTDPILRQWHMNVAQALHNPDGSFAGIIDIAYRTASIIDLFNQIALGPGSFEAVIGLNDGKLRAAAGPTEIDPNAAISGTPVFAAIEQGAHGIWIGPSPIDGVTRIHAFRSLPNHALAVIVAMDQSVAMRPAAVWRQQAQVFAGCITVLLAGVAALLVQLTRRTQFRLAALAEGQAVLASANAQLETARAVATAKAEQLGVTLSGMSDGLAMFDARMRLVEWNDRFAEMAGISPAILSVGLPIEAVLRAQINSGQHGNIDDADAEVARQMANLRHDPGNVVQQQRPDGHTLELRHNRLPNGGMVTLYADITQHKQAADALREARTAAETATAARSRFTAVVSHEIRTPLNAMLNIMNLISDGPMTPAQQSLLATARRSGDALSGLISDILEMAQNEAGKLMIRPSLFELRSLMASSLEMLEAPAAERGIGLRVSIAEATRPMLYADAGRLRQVLLNLLSNAVKYAADGDIVLQAAPGRTAADAVTLAVKDRGPVIEATARGRLFQPFSRLEQLDGDVMLGAGLGLSICRELVTLMGGTIGCETWTTPEGQLGNTFWLTLPASVIPDQLPPGAALPISGRALPDLPRRRTPRTSVLLVEDLAANQIVTATLLRREGHRVDVVASGEASIEAVQQASYDLVFMDNFMPGMSGLEATAVIRSLPEPACSVPILALTADTSLAHEANFRACGMDGSLGKPVSLTELRDALNNHVWSGNCVAGIAKRSVATTGDIGQRAPATQDTANPVLAMDRIMEIRDKLPPQTFASLVDECLADLERRMPALKQALAAGSIGAIAAHSHAMVGMAGGYGMATLEASLRTIMAAAHTGDTGSLGSGAFATVEANLAAANRALREMLRDGVA